MNKGKTPKFLSLFVPQEEWFQNLLKSKAENRSLSSYLLQLVVKDLRTRKLITKETYQQYMSYKRPEIRSTRFVNEDEMHATFSLYLPKRGKEHEHEFQWLHEVLDSKFLKENCQAKSRSIYIWNLFIKDNAKELSAAQAARWEAVRLGETRGETMTTKKETAKHVSRAS